MKLKSKPRPRPHFKAGSAASAAIQPARFVDHSIVAYALVQSNTDESKIYFVAKHQSGRITCNCPAATYGKFGKLCKHAQSATRDNLFVEV